MPHDGFVSASRRSPTMRLVALTLTPIAGVLVIMSGQFLSLNSFNQPETSSTPTKDEELTRTTPELTAELIAKLGLTEPGETILIPDNYTIADRVSPSASPLTAPKTHKNPKIQFMNNNMQLAMERTRDDLLLQKQDDPDDPYPCPMDLSYKVNNTRVSKCRSNFTTSRSDGLVIDVLSIGTKHRLHYLEGQYSSWASHSSVRNFIGITEADDDDPECELKMTPEQLRNHNKQCRRKHAGEKLIMFKYLTVTFLTRKSNPFGWLCAQKRPGSAIGKAAKYYATLSTDELPDYLLLVDDDTYLRMDYFVDEMKQHDSSRARVWGGCLTLAKRREQHRFTPIGGMGTYYSKGAIRRWLAPLNCNNGGHTGTEAETDTRSIATDTSIDDREWSRRACAQMRTSVIPKLTTTHEEGMSLAQHARRVFSLEPNCMISDWLIGHYVSHFELSADTWQEVVANRTDSRMFPYQRSFQLLDQEAMEQLTPLENPGRGCDCADGDNCNDIEMSTCHYINPAKMRNFSSQWL